MPFLRADSVTVLPEQRDILERLMRTRSTPQQLALRARLILHAAMVWGCARVDGTRCVAEDSAVLAQAVAAGSRGQSVPDRLTDAPRSGAPAKFMPEQVCALVAMTCEKPSESERPISNGASARLPMKRCDAASSRIFRSARGAFF